MRMIPVLGLSALLLGCTVAQLSTASQDLKAAGQAILSTVDAACGTVVPIMQSAVHSSSKTVTSLLSYAGSICALTGKVQPGVAVAVDTPAWLGGIGQALVTATATPAPPAAPAQPATPVAVPATVVTTGSVVTQPAPAPVTVAVPAAALPAKAP